MAQARKDIVRTLSRRLSASSRRMPEIALAIDASGGTTTNIAAALEEMTLEQNGEYPTSDECINHLKLLHAMHQLREDVGSLDGLYGLFNHFVKAELSESDRERILGKMREKRWAIFVGQAVRRFEKWFQALEPNNDKLTLKFMNSAQYPDIHTLREALVFDTNTLPPLGEWCDTCVGLPCSQKPDVLTVWHTFLLSPRKFFSDCVRHNKIGFWRSGLPLDIITKSINDEDYSYNPGSEAQKHFIQLTGLPWENRDMGSEISTKCVKCKQNLNVPLTTCGKADYWKVASQAGDGGQGYADVNFRIFCKCYSPVDHEKLRVQRFQADVQDLVEKNVPMSGTVLSMDGSIVQASIRTVTTAKSCYVATFPNRLLLAGVVPKLVELVSSDGASSPRVNFKAISRVSDIRDALNAILKERTEMLKITKLTTRELDSLYTELLGHPALDAVRRMMFCYGDNDTIFSLDLVGAVIRQNSFTEKMHSIDWLHSPALQHTMTRLIAKYLRFFGIMRQDPSTSAVPTLDVDLAWHTHQLNPPSYRSFSIANTGRMVNHDDAIDENKLSMSFEWTSKTYERMYNSVYAECICWYCEAIREAQYRRTPHWLRSKKVQQELKQLYAENRDPEKAAHISAHNAIKVDQKYQEITMKYVREFQLERSYQKAVLRAKKQGRVPPVRETQSARSPWGYTVKVEFHAPHTGDQCLNSSLYPADPTFAVLRGGPEGSCCTGIYSTYGDDGGDGGDGGDAGGCSTCGNCGGGGDD